MSKQFSNFRQELEEAQLNEEIYFGDMSDELLFDIIANESADEYHFTNALITLFERELVELSESDLSNLFEAPLSAFGSAGEKVQFGRDRNSKELQQSKQMSKLSQSSGPAPRGVSGPTAKPAVPTAVQTKDMSAKPTSTTSTGSKPLSAGGSARSNVEAGRAANAGKAQAIKNNAKLSQASMSVNQAKTAQTGLDAARSAVGSSAKTSIGNALKSAAGTAGRLASRYSPHATALATGYEAGKQLNKISAVSKVTDKVGKWVADKISSKPEVNTAQRTSPPKSQSEKPVLMGANQLSRFQQKNPEQKGKVMGVNQQARMDTKNPTTAPKPTAPSSKPVAQKSVPKMASAPAKSAPSKPQTNNTMGMSSAAYNDLKSSASKMKSATSDMASKTGAMKTSLQKAAPAGRMERPISPGGQSSSNIHKSIAKLGGEPTRAAAPAPKPVSKPAAVSGGAPTTAVGSKPPPLDRSTAKKM